MIENAIAYRDLDVAEASWYAIYTVVRHEKSVNAALADKGIDTFLPIKKDGKTERKRLISLYSRVMYL